MGRSAKAQHAFINQGNGVFINEAEARGMKHKGQSWTGSFADYDNDGDQDCLITNHDVPHALMRNDGTGHFTEHVLNVPLDASFAFQSLWADFDNNGYLDFLITGADKTYFYMNRDGENFDRVEGVFEVTLNSAALGDINDDGCIDLSAYYGIGINLPGLSEMKFSSTRPNMVTFLKFALRGSSSNAMGLGQGLNCTVAGENRPGEVHAGLSYGVSNSLIQHFGLGTSQLADSLVVYWPSGQKSIPTNQCRCYLFCAGRKVHFRRVAMKRSNIILCPGDNVQLILPLVLLLICGKMEAPLLPLRLPNLALTMPLLQITQVVNIFQNWQIFLHFLQSTLLIHPGIRCIHAMSIMPL